MGCIFGELLNSSPLFPGENDIEQLCCVLRMLGTPTQESWPVRCSHLPLTDQWGSECGLFNFMLIISLQEIVELPDYNKITFKENPAMPLDDIVPDACPQAVDLLHKFLVYPSKQRCSARQVGTQSGSLKSFMASLIFCFSKWHEETSKTVQIFQEISIKGKKNKTSNLHLFHHCFTWLCLSFLFSLIYKNVPTCGVVYRRSSTHISSRPPSQRTTQSCPSLIGRGAPRGNAPRACPLISPWIYPWREAWSTPHCCKRTPAASEQTSIKQCPLRFAVLFTCALSVDELLNLPDDVKCYYFFDLYLKKERFRHSLMKLSRQSRGGRLSATTTRMTTVKTFYGGSYFYTLHSLPNFLFIE